MVINDLLARGMALIEEREYSNPRLEAVLVLAHLLEVDKSYIYIHGDKEVSKDIEHEFMGIMGKRANGHPLQYLLNREDFMGLSFYIEEGVLIPRPETELLVEFIIDYICKDSRVNILDIGVGSGAISLSIAKNCPNARVIGIDIGDTPIKVANINKESLGIENALFYQGDMFEALEKNKIDKRFHIIVSNPPYIRTKDLEDLQVEVRNHEPLLALDGGCDGLNFYRRISKEASRYLKADGMLAYEIGFNQGEEVRDIMLQEGYKDISILKDYQGHDRIVYGFKN